MTTTTWTGTATSATGTLFQTFGPALTSRTDAEAAALAQHLLNMDAAGLPVLSEPHVNGDGDPDGAAADGEWAADRRNLAQHAARDDMDPGSQFARTRLMDWVDEADLVERYGLAVAATPA